jgi:PH domain
VFGGEKMTGCEVETGVVPFGSVAKWYPEEWLATLENLQNIHPDSRVVFQLQCLCKDVEPVVLAAIAVPLCNDRGHLISGRHCYRLWTNRHDVMLMPPSPPLQPVHVGHTGDGGVELHVEFESFAGTVAASPSPALWELAESVSTPDAPRSRITLPPPVSGFLLADAITSDFVSLKSLGPEWRRFNRHALITACDPVLERIATKSPAAVKKDKHPQLDRNGYMEKLGKSSASKWRRRWFVLNSSDGTLSYFVSDRDTEPRGVIDLQGVHVSLCREYDRSFQRIVGSTRKDYSWYAFKVGRPGERQYIMSCTVKQEVMDWMDAIKTVAVTIPPSRQSSGKKPGLLSRLWSRVKTTSSPTHKVDKEVSSGSPSEDGSTPGPSGPRDATVSSHGSRAAFRRKSHYVTARRAQQASAQVSWSANGVTMAGGATGDVGSESSITSTSFKGSTVLWLYALEALATTDRLSLPLCELKDVVAPGDSAASVVSTSRSSVVSSESLSRPVSSTGSVHSPSFLCILNDPAMMASFAVFLDRQYCTMSGPSGAISASDLLFWTECEALFRRFADLRSASMSKPCFESLYAVLCRYLMPKAHVRVMSTGPESLATSEAPHRGIVEFTTVAWPDPAVVVAVSPSVARLLDSVVDDDTSPTLFTAMYDAMIQAQSEVKDRLAVAFQTFAQLTVEKAIGFVPSPPLPCILYTPCGSLLTPTSPVYELCTWSRNFATLSGHADLLLETLKLYSVDEDYLSMVLAQHFPVTDPSWRQQPPSAVLSSDASLDFRMWMSRAEGGKNVPVAMPHCGTFTKPQWELATNRLSSPDLTSIFKHYASSPSQSPTSGGPSSTPVDPHKSVVRVDGAVTKGSRAIVFDMFGFDRSRSGSCRDIRGVLDTVWFASLEDVAVSVGGLSETADVTLGVFDTRRARSIAGLRLDRPQIEVSESPIGMFLTVGEGSVTVDADGDPLGVQSSTPSVDSPSEGRSRSASSLTSIMNRVDATTRKRFASKLIGQLGVTRNAQKFTRYRLSNRVV